MSNGVVHIGILRITSNNIRYNTGLYTACSDAGMWVCHGLAEVL